MSHDSPSQHLLERGAEDVKPMLQRFYVLFVYFWACFVQGIVWTPLSALPNQACAVFPTLSDGSSLSSTLIFWSLNLGPMVYIPVAPFAAWLLTTRGGLRRTVRLGLLFSSVCASLRLCVLASPRFRASASAGVMLLLSGAFCGIAAPFTQGSPARLSAVWFPASERTRATAAGYLGTYLGSAASYIVSPGIVRESVKVAGTAEAGDNGSCAAAAKSGASGALLSQFETLIWLEAVLCWVPLVLSLLYFPESPAELEGRNTNDGTTDEDAKRATAHVGGHDVNGVEPDKRSSFADNCRGLLRNRDFMLIVLSCGFVQGFYSSWGASLALVLSQIDISTADADKLAFIGTLTYVVGSYALGEAADRFLRRRLKALIVALLAGGICTFLWFGLSVDSLKRGFHPIPSTLGSQATAIALAGFLIGGTAGLYMELAAETAFPIPEGFASNAIGLAINVTGCICLGIFPYVSAVWVNPIMFVVMVVCLLLIVLVRERYLRSDADR